MGTVEIMPRIERRRRWTPEEKVALLAEVEAAGGSVSAVARRHQVSESVLYNWRAALRAAATVAPPSEPTAFISLGVLGGPVSPEPARLAPPPQKQPTKTNSAAGVIEIALPNGARALRANEGETSAPRSLALRVLKDHPAHAHANAPDRA